MRAFLIKVGLFLLCLFCIDRAFILFRYANVFADIAVEKMKVLRKAVDSAPGGRVDIGIFGSSHVQFGVSPEIISDETHRYALNYGYGGGGNLGAQLSMMRGLGNLPATVALGVDVFALGAKPLATDDFLDSFFGRKASFTPRKDPLTYSYIYLYTRFIPMYVSHAKKGKVLPPYFLKGNDIYDLSMFSDYRGYDITPLGWVKGDALINKQFVRYAYDDFVLDSAALKCLSDISDLCRQHNSRLVLFQVPEHAVSLVNKEKYARFDTLMRSFAKQKDCVYWDFDKASVFPVDNDTLFFDSDHLNVRGAELFSSMLADSLESVH